MIILIIALFTVATFICFLYIKKTKLRWTLGVLSMLLLVASILLLVANFSGNWGTKTITTRQTSNIYTAGETNVAYNLLIKQEIGTGSHNYAFVYRTNKNEIKAKAHFVPDTNNISQAVKKRATYQMTSQKQATVVTVKKYRKLSNGLPKFLFNLGNNNQKLLKQTTTVYLPENTWLVLTETQAKELKKKAPELEKAANAQAEQQASQLKAAIAATPTPEAKQALEEEAQKKIADEEAIKNNPSAYAKAQITAIRQALNIKK
ncbi:DUF4811 domain-containing protein [Lactococcus nasutitermitis]|uniref:DUF4811 domain-containing protein n=1 Tax=Lactococcus nasutitermitis TaxID=1652957 RepID=A0ABV9JDE3_9LACT|nr:DUF4811 domain-containing protein [Lactococcus nasutitermitis]